MFKLKKYIKSIIKESLVDNDKAKGRIGLILLKFPALKKALTKLLSKSFMYFIKDIKVIAPKPTMFEVKLVNNLTFYLQYVFKAENWIVKISGKNYNLSLISDSQRAMSAISELLSLSPAVQEATPSNGGGSEFNNDPGANAFNDTFSGGGGFNLDNPIAPSDEIGPGTEPLPLDNPNSQGEEQDDVTADELQEIKKIKLKEFLNKIS